MQTTRFREFGPTLHLQVALVPSALVSLGGGLALVSLGGGLALASFGGELALVLLGGELVASGRASATESSGIGSSNFVFAVVTPRSNRLNLKDVQSIKSHWCHRVHSA